MGLLCAKGPCLVQLLLALLLNCLAGTHRGLALNHRQDRVEEHLTGTEGGPRFPAPSATGHPRVFRAGSTPKRKASFDRVDTSKFSKRQTSMLHSREFVYDGLVREYQVYFPSLPAARLPPEGLPLVIALHCYGCTEQTFFFLAEYCEVSFRRARLGLSSWTVSAAS
eukprot:scaffold990_cov393-Prasinococcus_capsulatus_cf.AAC.43